MKNILYIFVLTGIVSVANAKLKCNLVTPSEAQCKENEAFNTCGSVCSEPKCPRLGYEEMLCAAVCVEGCFCIDGFVRDPSGKCVLLQNCPAVQCPKNEHFTDCGGACEPTCENQILLFCPYICKPGCVCDEGFVRNSEGVCVQPKQCPTPECKDNEEYLEFGSPCESTCQHPGEIFCKAASRPGCFCKEGFVRDENNRCILKEECPKVECFGANEVYNDCGSTCGDLRCDLPSFAAVSCVEGCSVGCYCAKDFVRNNEGICVLLEECPPVGHCGGNEIWNDCGPAEDCEASCDNPDLINVMCIDMCFPKCVCEEGYVKGPEGNCISRDSCPIAECVGENEVFSNCGSGCGDLSCETPSFAAVSCPAVCNRGCFCAEGFVRSAEGKCIKESECPTCPENERYTQCGAACQSTCSNQNPLICPAICMSGCLCAFGLTRNAEGKCVKPSECPQVECPENEHYTDCGSSCGDLSCNLQSFAAVLCPDVCKNGCFCNEGYVRNSENVCIPPKSCPSNGCNAGEVWNDCGPVDYCEATCKNPDLIDAICPDVCVSKCVCQEGYVRDANWHCVKKDSCSAVQCGANEHYTDCGSGCGDLTCENPVHEICADFCNVGCFCNEGFVRNSKGACIPKEECPSKKCKVNEEYSECGANGCQATCENPNLPQVCRAMCISGCVCKNSFLRDSDGKCVKPKDCPNDI